MSFGADTQQRLARRQALVARNRLVSILRIGLPALGIVVVVLFFLQILLASFLNDFRIGNITVSGDSVAIDTPSYSGVTADGDLYTISAQGASTAITNLNLIAISNGELAVTQPDGEQMWARTAHGSFDSIAQTMTIPGVADVSNSSGDKGTLRQVVVDVPHKLLTASGPVAIQFQDGSKLAAEGMRYDAHTRIWTFDRATLVVPDAGEDDPMDGEQK